MSKGNPVRVHRVNGVDLRVLDHVDGNPVIAKEDFEVLVKDKALSAAVEMLKLQPQLTCEETDGAVHIYGRAVQWVPTDEAVEEIDGDVSRTSPPDELAGSLAANGLSALNCYQ